MIYINCDSLGFQLNLFLVFRIYANSMCGCWIDFPTGATVKQQRPGSAAANGQGSGKHML